MKEYKALKSFSSPRIGNVDPGDNVTIDGGIGDQMAEEGYLIESKPAAKAASKEVKPKPAAKKKVKGE